MNSFISKNQIDQWIKEDIPYMDLTTFILGISSRTGRITYSAREFTIAACVEEAVQVMTALGLEIENYKPSGTELKPGEVILSAKGYAEALQKAWRTVVNILEYSSGIATRTFKTLGEVRRMNPEIHLLSTRKVFPGTKELSVKAVMAGGGYPHRLGLSESILIFDQHLKFFGSEKEADKAIRLVKKESLEKKVIVEVQSKQEVERFLALGIDGIQFDKFCCEDLAEAVGQVKKVRPEMFLIAAGGVNSTNAVDYAKTGVDALVTSAMYFGKPADIKAVMTPL